MKRTFVRTHLTYGLLASTLIGIFFVKLGYKFNPYLFAIAFFGLITLPKKNTVSLIAIILFGLSLGLWRGEYYQQQLEVYSQYLDSKITVEGQVLDDPAYNDRKQTEFHLGNVHLDDNQELAGRIKVSTFGGSNIQRGDLLKVTGKLREGFGNRQGTISFAAFESIGRYDSKIEKLRREYFAGVNSALPEPQSSLGLGFLVGLRTILPEELLEKLSATGLTHIVAVSGYNLTILIRYARKYMMRFSKFIATAASVSLIVGFLAITGLSPSIFRASIVSGFALFAWYNGRDIKPMMLILLGASITAFIQPTFLWLDIGWWLSFLAFFGVLILAPLMTGALLKKEPKFVMRTLIETTCAQAFALPLIVLIFGELSLISILANMLILPLIPFAMLLTFAAGLAGMITPTIAGWVAWPAKILLTYMTELISLLAQTPYALIQINVDKLGFLVIILSFIGLTLVLSKKSNQEISGTYIIE